MARDDVELVLPLPASARIVDLPPMNGIPHRGGLDPNEAIVRGTCPACKQPASLWLWIENTTETHEQHPRRLTLAGVVTSVVHDSLEAASNCGGPL